MIFETLSFNPGDFILREGDIGKGFYILEQGELEVTRDERVINEIRKRNTATILISHNLDQVFRLADRLVVVHQGNTSKEFLRNEVTIDELVKAITTG